MVFPKVFAKIIMECFEIDVNKFKSLTQLGTLKMVTSLAAMKF